MALSKLSPGVDFWVPVLVLFQQGLCWQPGYKYLMSYKRLCLIFQAFLY